MLFYTLPDLSLTIVLADRVLEHFGKYQQLNSRSTEAGGQLFACFENSLTIIQQATGPRSTDKRTRTSYQPDRRAEQKEILKMFKKDLHYVGDWHTHPCHISHPSGTDILSIKSCVLNSFHQLNGFVLIIVGTASFPASVRVSVHDGTKEHLLQIKGEGNIYNK